MNKRNIFVLILISFLLFSCGSLGNLSRNECQANPSRLLASIQVPSGGQIKRAGASVSQLEAVDFVTIGSEWDVSQLLQHYNSQTEKERDDWTFLESEVTAHVAWSSWSVVDECGELWYGLITVNQPPSLPDPFLTIRVKKSGW